MWCLREKKLTRDSVCRADSGNLLAFSGFDLAEQPRDCCRERIACRVELEHGQRRAHAAAAAPVVLRLCHQVGQRRVIAPCAGLWRWWLGAAWLEKEPLRRRQHG